jgi:exodeoxyribonuclease V gamma subunit
VIRIHYSNRLEELVRALASRLPPPRDRAALFDGPWVVVPSRPLELFVDLELARQRGISGNVETLSARGLFARLCARALPELVLIERGHIVAELLAALSSTAVMQAEALAPLARYLLAAGSAEEAVDRRRVELAQGLGALLDDWPLTRPERIASWRAGRGTADDFSPLALGPLARAERALWTELFDPAGRFARRGRAEGRRYLTLDDVLGEDLDARWQPPAAVHLFGLSGVPRGLQLALARLAARTEVELYVVNPCREFWEDVDTRRRRRRSSAPAPAPPPPPPPPPPAALQDPPRSPTSQVTRRRRMATGAGRAGSTAGPRQLELGLFGGARAEPPGDEADGAVTADDPVEQDDPFENPFLEAWGHAGRESTRLLNQLSDGDFDATFVDPIRAGDLDGARATDTLLRLVQQDILDRRPARRAEAASRGGRGRDESLQILGAPNPRRELESIAAQIWSMVRADAQARPEPTSPLRFSDVAVLIAGGDEPYLSLARAVFREAHDLPHSIVDQRISDTSPLIEVVLALLELPLGQLTRREVLDVITHPNVLARFPDADPGLWLRLCEGLAIVHGSDRTAHAGTYIDGDLFNWDQGLKRLALGLFARGPRSGAEHPALLPTTSSAADVASGARDTDAGTGYAPAELPTDARAAANCLGLLARSLLADARFARSARMPVGDWMRFVRALVAAYTVPVTSDDEAARLRVHAVVEQLAAEADRELPVALGTALELVRAALTALRTTRGQLLGAGVTVGTLAALRSVPFRVIFVAGLGRERFPAAEHPSPLELDPERQRAGDVTGRQEDRYLFLEALLAARDALVLSYVDRDPVSGEPEEPSPLILELVDQLERGSLDDGASGTSGTSGTMLRRIPLHRDDDPRVLSAFPAAAAEARARVLGESLRDAVPHVGKLAIPEIVGALSPATRQTLAPLLRAIDLPREEGEDTGVGAARARRPDQTPAPPVRPRVLQLSDLRRFLECPLQGSARIYLGLRDRPDDTEARETGDEPFGVPRWLERRLLSDVLVRAWTGTDLPDLSTLEAGYDAALGRPGYGRLLPAGLFRANVRRYHLDILEQWVRALTPASKANEASLASPDGPRGPLRRVCFGRPEPFATPAERRAPICLTVDVPGQGPTPVELHGETEPQIWFGAQAAGSLVLSPSASSDRERSDKDSLRAFIDHVALAASRPEGAPPAALFKGALCRPSREPRPSPASPISFAALDRLRARSYLSALVGEILGGVHDYLFPCEAVFRSWDQQMSLCDRIDQVRADKFYRERCSSSHGPVADPFAYPTPSAERAARYADSRFGLLYRERQEPRSMNKRGRA